jgi:hypothetical protein
LLASGRGVPVGGTTPAQRDGGQTDEECHMRHKWSGGAAVRALALAFALAAAPAEAFYSPTQGRWLSRDPMEEIGGLHLIAFVRNDGINSRDPLGLKGVSKGECGAMVSRALEANRDISLVFVPSPTCQWPRIVCECCDEYARYEPFWLFGLIGNEIHVCRNMFDAEDQEEMNGTIRHELVHWMQFCSGMEPNTCESIICMEIEAWYHTPPCASLPEPGRTTCARDAGGNEGKSHKECEGKDVYSLADSLVEKCKKKNTGGIK